MNRLQTKLKQLKTEEKKALVAYLVAGDPDIDSTLELMHLFVSSGVDIIEIGVPFTDPIAEGPIIQKAHDRSLKHNISLQNIIDLVKDFRQVDTFTPIVLMGYLNTFIAHINLINQSDAIGVDAVLVVDIPGELELSNYGIKHIEIGWNSNLEWIKRQETIFLLVRQCGRLLVPCLGRRAGKALKL